MLVKLTLALSALGLLGFGLAMLIAPAAMLAPVDLAVETAAAYTEIRVFYGGLEIALGLALFHCLRQPALHRQGLQLSALCYGCVALTRGSSMLIEGSGGAFLWSALTLESLLTLACLWALRGLARER